MNIKVTTYINNKKLLFENNQGDLLEKEKFYQIIYEDKNFQICDIKIEKSRDKVVIKKGKSSLNIEKEVGKSQYMTDYGLIDLYTQLLTVDIKEKSKFIQFEVEYRIIFSKIDNQLNKLKILISR